MRRAVLVPRAVLFLCCFAFAISLGCAKRDLSDLLAPNEVGTIVVQATLVVGERFPRVTLSQTLSPDRPYDDPRVSLHVDDGRAFMERATRRYDLVLFALPDSATIVTGQSALRVYHSPLLTQVALVLLNR